MKVEFLTLPNGRRPAEEFFGELDNKTLAKIYKLIERLETEGRLVFPHARKLEGYKGLWELRINSQKGAVRVFLCVLGTRNYYFSFGFCQKVPKNPIKRVRKNSKLFETGRNHFMKRKLNTKSVREFFNKKFKEKNFAKAYEDMGPLMDIAVEIAKARNKIGLSQSDLAHKLKTSQPVVSRIENGNQNLSVKMLARIAQVLDCDLLVSLRQHKLAA